MWKVSCGRCGYSEEVADWRTVLHLARFHASEFEHWGHVLLRRPVDNAGYVLRTWGAERRLLKKAA